jgi:hypothetical protein
MTQNRIFLDPDDLLVSIPWEHPLSDNMPPSLATFGEFDSPPGGLTTKIELFRASSTQPDTCYVTSVEIQEFSHQKMRNHDLNDSPNNHVISPDSGENYQKWRKLTLVAKSIHRFRSLRVERIKSEFNLKISIRDTPFPKRNTNTNKDPMCITPKEMYNDALNEFREQTAFFEALQIASTLDLTRIRATLMNDPKENFYDAESPFRLANKPNHKGYTPLYIACKNGHLELVKLLIEFKANPYQLCKISPKEKESVLIVAARWGHIDILKYLLSDKFIWPQKELKKACKEAQNNQTKKVIKMFIEKNKSPLLERIFACSTRKINYLG